MQNTKRTVSTTTRKPSSNNRTSNRWTARWVRKNYNVNLTKWSKKDTSKPLNKKPDFKIKSWETPVKVGSLLGLEQVGQCIFIEYKNDMILVDAGMEFASWDLTMWADYIIPDISYVKKNIKKLKGILLTHWHLDHIWALRDILPELNYPTLYTTPLTLGLVKKSFEDPRNIKKIKYKLVDTDTEIIKIGCFSIEFAGVNHNIPETYAISINTPKWTIFTSADFKIDYTPSIDKPADLAKISRIGTEGVKFYIWDSLNSWKQWYVQSEKVIWDNLSDIIRKTPWRLIIATFATNVWRSIQVIKNAVKNNKVVFLSGRSMLNNIEVCKELWYVNVPNDYLRKLDKTADEMPDNKVVILSTWAQWEEFSALARMARWEHAQIQLRKWDTILLSSTVIPWNERAMMTMKNNLVNKQINLITNDDMDVHASWHGWAEDHKLMLHLLKPDYFMPFYMDAFPRFAHKNLAIDMWFDEEKIIMPEQNWSIIELYDNGVKISDEKLKLNTILIDGKWVWHLSWEYVIRARKIMSEDGMLTFILKIDTNTKEIIGNIQIESRWFVYSSEVKKIHTDIVNYIRKKYNLYYKKMWTKFVLKKIKEELTNYIVQIIWREPMIVPMFVYINRESIKSDINEEDAIIWMTLEEQGWE